MKILVLGGSGLVGKNLQHVVKHSVDEWVFCSSNDGDLTDYDQTYQLIMSERPHTVINLTAYVGGLYKNIKEPVEFFTNNIIINMNVMKACHNLKTHKLVSMLSTCIFPNEITYPIDETHLHLGPPHYSNECYSYSKRMVDVLSRAYNKEYGCKFVTVIPGNIYGPYDNFNLKDAHVIPALIHKCYLAQKQGTALEICGSGLPLRQFTYALDIAELLIWVVNNFEDTELPLIISSTEEMSIVQVVEKITKEFGFTGKTVWNITQSDGQYKKTISDNRLQSLTGGVTFTPFTQGIHRTVKWFQMESLKLKK
jgi:GDP-L-fucose synthase